MQVAVFNGQSRYTEVQPVDEGSGHAAADDSAPDAEQNVESAQRDWMHRLRPGDIVLVSGVSFCASDEFNAIVEVACQQISSFPRPFFLPDSVTA